MTDNSVMNAMDEVSRTAQDDEYWAGVMEEDSVESFANLASWQGFLPPPPRPSFLDELASADSLTSCEMCSWAYQDGASSMQVTQETAAELGWVLTLAVVSLLSAAIGAAVMVTVLHCRSRLSSGFGSGGLCTLCVGRAHAGRVSAPTSPLAGGGVVVGEDKETVGGVGGAAPQDVSGPLLALWRGRSSHGLTGWPWRRREAPKGAGKGPKGPAPENHYTLEELAYSGVSGASDEALYAELDRPSVRGAYQYQNAAPLANLTPPCHCGQGLVPQGQPGPDTPSAPSSAYYSDLSAPDRTYEAVGVGNPMMAVPAMPSAMPCLSLQVNPHWEAAAAAAEAARRRQLAHQHLQRQFQQLQHIQMAPQQLVPADSSVPSDYV
ncbi:uncharacterized protein LOC117640457 isoform X2 [Thrips palmi]|uniref:Uncharacterized protein LOC117640457 isoform X2 n=1 Tax=Thrips palmi TaxID=161013 RepID=A0A6P8Y085_THRPL|nr:uncharacterized protein LOC117640457 isoform X2 [Thrips palmi]